MSTSEPSLPVLLRTLAPQVLSALMRRYRDFAAAEDAVQEALLAAAEQWPSGRPEQPRSWLIQVAFRRMTDRSRSDRARRRREEASVRDEPADPWVAPALDDDLAASGRDDTLLLLFMCCHPALSRTSSIALTLRAVGGLSTAEIAAAFMVPEPTMAQRISRAKQSVRASGVPFAMPSERERDARLSAVLHVLYLIFNEGYVSSGGAALARAELSGEAIRLAREVHALLPEHGEVAGLLALMLLTDARRDARSGPDGELIPLPDQDRRLWNRASIAEGVALLGRVLPRGEIGAYQLQAAIQAVHDEAPDAKQTDWPQILALYEVLARLGNNPMVLLNKAVALAMVEGPAAGLALLDALATDPRLAATHRVDAVRAHLHEMGGDLHGALAHYDAAASKTNSLPEQSYLRLRAARVRAQLQG